MRELPPGVYEELITTGVEARLAPVDSELVLRDQLDPADADVALARHIGRLTQRALRSLPTTARGDDRDLVTRQVELTNRIALAIVDAVPNSVWQRSCIDQATQRNP